MIKNNAVLLAFSGLVLWSLIFPVKQKTATTNEIDDAITRGTAFLENIQRTDGAICDTVNPLFDVWETVLATTALYELKQDTNDTVLRKALYFLRDNENAAGLICHNRKCKSATCIETTAAYFLLLLKTGEFSKVIVRSDTLRALQKISGEWLVGNPDVREQTDFPSVTGFMLQLFRESGQKPVHSQNAVDWLLHRQTAEGHWGSAWEYYDCPAYALWPILPVLNVEKTAESQGAIEKVLHYIRTTQRVDGSWENAGATRSKKPSAELNTALMLAAISGTSLYKEESVVNPAINFLLSHQQNSGAWDGGFFPIDSDRYEKKEYIFASAMALRALHHYRQYLKTAK